jgi:hypothetical protein
MNFRRLDEIEVAHGLAGEHFRNKNDLTKNQINNKFDKVWFYLTLLLTAAVVIISLSAVRLQNENARTLKNYQRELQIKEIQNTLSGAVIASNRNEFELSRQTINDFFELLEKEMALGNDSVFNLNQREAVKEILQKKALVNQSLAEKNPRAREQLENVLETYQKAVKSFRPLNKKEK